MTNPLLTLENIRSGAFPSDAHAVGFLLGEIERLQSNQRDHLQEITALTQQRDDYKDDYLRIHKQLVDLKYPGTMPTHEPSVRPYEQVIRQSEREGVDAQDLIETLMKKVEDQRRELARLNVEHRTAVGTRVPVTDRRVESAISEEGVPLCSADDLRALLNECLDADDGYTLGKSLMERIERALRTGE